MTRVLGALLFACAACGPSPAYAPEKLPPIGEWSPAPHDYATPLALGQKWIGRLQCGAGEIILAVTVVGLDGADVRAIVETENAATHAEGIFESHGRWITESRELELAPVRVLKAAPGDEPFGLRGAITVSERRWIGTAGEGSCPFSLRVVP